MKVKPHTSLKHRLLGCYYKICRQVAKKRSLFYVDLFAGDGEVECDEAPMPKWDPPYITGLLNYADKGEIGLHCFFNELDPKNDGSYDKLKKKLEPYNSLIKNITKKDANEAYKEVLPLISKTNWSIFFLDPFQHDHLKWDTIEAISKHEAYDPVSRCKRKPELIINLMTSTMQRAYKFKPESLTDALGDDGWKDLILEKMDDEKIHEVLSNYYIKKLNKLGYTVNSIIIKQTPPNKGVLYYMVFASSIPDANDIIDKFMKYAKNIMNDKWVKENFICRLISKNRKSGQTSLGDY